MKKKFGIILLCMPMPALANSEMPNSLEIVGNNSAAETVVEDDLADASETLENYRIPYPGSYAVRSESPYVEEQSLLQYKRRDATRWEIGYQVLNIIDAVQTAECLNRHSCEEANPLFRATLGKRPAPLAMVGTKALIGVGHWLIFSQLRKNDPDRARQMARWSFALQGSMVVVNARIAF